MQTMKTFALIWHSEFLGFVRNNKKYVDISFCLFYITKLKTTTHRSIETSISIELGATPFILLLFKKSSSQIILLVIQTKLFRSLLMIKFSFNQWNISPRPHELCVKKIDIFVRYVALQLFKFQEFIKNNARKTFQS